MSYKQSTFGGERATGLGPPSLKGERSCMTHIVIKGHGDPGSGLCLKVVAHG